MTGNITGISARLSAVRDRISAAARAASRSPDGILLVAVSKTHAEGVIRDAAAAGQRHFGENQLQEALSKIAATADLGLVWHFIGPVQSNKSRSVAEHFDWVHSVDRLKIAERLSQQRPADLAPLNICIQVNVSGEESKSGVAPEQTLELAGSIAQLPQLRLRGLMTIPRPSSDPVEQAAAFRRLCGLYQRLLSSGFALDTLSMGMSADLESAVKEGSTLVRVGTAIFGTR